MLHSDELRLLEEQEELFMLAMGYLASCEFLCESMINEQFEGDFARSRVVLNLCHHGIELFFKASILAKTGEAQTGHNLKRLNEKYRLLFSGDDFEIPVPFGYDSGDLFPEYENKMYNELHQRFRYSSDLNGQRWPGIEGFLPSLFLSDVSKLKSSVLSVWLKVKDASKSGS